MTSWKVIFNIITLLVPLAALAWLVLAAGRGRGKSSGKKFEPSALTPAPGPFIQSVEALALALIGGTVFVMIATNTNTGGALLTLDKLQPAWRSAFLGATGATGLMVVLSVFLVWRFRTLDGVLLMTAALGLYGGYLNLGDYQSRYLPNQRITQPDTELIIRICREYDDIKFEYQGADLWVNNVYLGKTPLCIRLSEFKRRVPQWDKPPQNMNEYTTISSYGVRGVFHNPRMASVFKFHDPDMRSGINRKPDKEDCYFAKVALAGTRGYSWAGYSGRGSEGRSDIDYTVTFPEIDARIEKLLNKARLNDYKVDAAWIAAMDSYGEPAWKLINYLARREPALASLVRQRLEFRFGLDRIKTPEQAWGFFEGIMAEADRTGRFDTATSTGQAVALVAPRLAPERLAREACRLIPQIDSMIIGWRKIEGRVEFEMPTFSRHGTSIMAESPNYGQVTGGFSNDSRLQPPRALVLAQAIRFANAALLEHNPGQPTVFQKEVVPELLRGQMSNDWNLQLATALGGPEIARFLVRQDWRAPVGFGTGARSNMVTRVGFGVEVNKWAYALCRLPGDEGRAFREDHRDFAINLARTIMQKHFDRTSSFWSDDSLDFIFLDPQRGDQSLAASLWPEYRRAVLNLKHTSIESRSALLWNYLVRMEPQTSTTLYADAWRDTFSADAANNAWYFKLTPLKQLPTPRRAEVLKAILEAIKQHPPEPGQNAGSRRQSDTNLALQFCRQVVEDQLLIAGDSGAMDSLLAELATPQGAKRREAIAGWLRQNEPTHPLVARLARHADPQLRLLALGSLGAAPTAANRSLLHGLLKDPDAAVRAAAQTTQDALDRLARTPARQFALTQ